MPNRQIYNSQADNVEVQIYGQDPTTSVKIDTVGRVSVTGLVNVTTLSPLSVTGSVIGNLTILNTPTVTIVGTPNISMTGTPVISGTIGITGTPTIQIGGHGSIQVVQNFTLPAIGLLLSYQTPGIYIANLNSFSYYIKTPSGLLSLLTIDSELSPDNSNWVTGDSFTNAQLLALNLSLGGNLATNKYLFYSRLNFKTTAALLSGGTVTVVFLGQY